MDFNQYYFNEENISEVNWLKSRFFGNALRSLVGSGKRQVNPKDFKQFTQLSPAGFSEIFSIFSNRYDNRKDLKYNIKNLYTAILDPKKAAGIFQYKDEKGQNKQIEFTSDEPKKQIKAASYYETNKGGRVMLVNLADDEGNDRYFIGQDGNALKFWNAPLKKGGIGKDFRTWLAAQAGASYKPSNASISPEFPGKGEQKVPTAAEKGVLKFKYEVPSDKYHDMIPKVAPMKIAASVEYPFSLLGMFEDEVLEEKVRAITKIGDEWFLVRKSKEGKWVVRQDNPVTSFKDEDYAVDSKGKKSEEFQKDLDTVRNKDKESKTREDQMKDQGTLFHDLKDELDAKQPPAKVKPSEKTKNG